AAERGDVQVGRAVDILLHAHVEQRDAARFAQRDVALDFVEVVQYLAQRGEVRNGVGADVLDAEAAQARFEQPRDDRLGDGPAAGLFALFLFLFRLGL